MRKPLVVLGLVLSTGLGASPVADALAASPSTTPPSPPPVTSPRTLSPSTVPAKANSVSGAQIVQTALKYLGYPYTATGNSPQTGFSCIGFASFVYRQNGISLPGDLGNAMAFSPAVPFSQLQPGDLLWFGNTIWNGLSHVAIYIGGGKFVHAEWYGYGVRISSFNNDPRDGNYWPAHYFGASRPWGGAAVTPVVNASVGNVAPPAPPGATALKQVSGGNAATVTVSSLNVRTDPAKSAGVQQIIPQGTSLIILGKSHGWYKVQLPDGSVGWVVAAGIGMAAPTAPPQQPVQTVANPTVGSTVAPVRQGAVTTKHRTATVTVTGLRVHSSPSLTAPVLTSVDQGSTVQVLKHRNGWMKVRTSTGLVGWVASGYTSAAKVAAQPAIPAANQVTAPGATSHKAAGTAAMRSRSYVTASVRVHATPSLAGQVIGAVGAGTHVKVLGYSGGFARVRLPSGAVGYIYAIYVRR